MSTDENVSAHKIHQIASCCHRKYLGTRIRTQFGALVKWVTPLGNRRTWIPAEFHYLIMIPNRYETSMTLTCPLCWKQGRLVVIFLINSGFVLNCRFYHYLSSLFPLQGLLTYLRSLINYTLFTFLCLSCDRFRSCQSARSCNQCNYD